MNSVAQGTEYQFRQYTVKPEGHHRYLHPVILRLLVKHVPQQTTLLEAGSGNGGLAKKLIGHYKLCGVDLSESGVAAARQQCPDFHFEVASVYDDLVARFGRTFPAAVSLEVIEHLYEPHVLMQRLHAAIEPGGTLIVSTPHHGYLKNLVMALGNRWDDHLEPRTTGGHIKFWSRRTLGQLFDENGFDVVEFAGAGRCAGLWKSMILVGRRRQSSADRQR